MQHGAHNYLGGPLTGPELAIALRETLHAGPPGAAASPPPAPDEQALQAHKMEAVGRLAGGVAHDFNNLLTVLTGYSDFLLNALPTAHPARPYAEEIQKAIQRGASVTRQLLAFSRKQPMRPTVLDLNALVLGTERLLRPLIGEHVELRLDLAAGGCPVKADAGQLEQVIVNLAVNARDAMPGGGRLTLRTTAGADTPAGADAASRWVLLAVSDTGVGMDEQTRAHLFEPFFTTKAPGKGTGLGLATVDGIVRQSGGHISVQSEPGRGTTFNVYWPQAQEAPRAAPAPAAGPGVLPRGSETVLVLEDEEPIRNLVRRILEMQGYRVLLARDGAEALGVAACEAEPVHLLLSDLVLPRMPGQEAARRLKQLRPDLRVLYISGYPDAPPRETLGTIDADILAKPFTAAALARKVREVLDR